MPQPLLQPALLELLPSKLGAVSVKLATAGEMACPAPTQRPDHRQTEDRKCPQVDNR